MADLKDKRLAIAVTSKDRIRIVTAARKDNLSISGYIIKASLDRADEVLAKT